MQLRRLTIPLAALALAACAGTTDGPIVVATAGPWQQPNGQMHLQGVKLALKQVNAGRRSAGRDTLQLVDRDDRANGAEAAKIASYFIDSTRAVAVVGHVNSGAMIAAAKLYHGQLPAVSSTASSPDLSGISSWVFRVIQSDSVSAEQLAVRAAGMGARTAAVFYENNSFGRGLAGTFRRNFERAGGRLLNMDPIGMSGRESFEPYVTYLRQRRPDVVFVGGSEQSGLALLREARRQGLSSAFMGGVGWTGIIADTAASEGAFVGVPFTPTASDQRARAFVDAFRAEFGVIPDGKAALAYDAMLLVARAIDEAGADRQKIRDWLRALNGSRKFEGGVTSTGIQFSESGDVIGGGFVFTQAQRGQLVARN